MKGGILLLSGLVCFLVHALAAAQEHDGSLISIQRQGPGGVLVPAENFKEGLVEIRLSEPLILVLEVSGGIDLEVALLDPAWVTPGWIVRRIGKPERDATRNRESSIVRVALELDPQKPGDLTVALPPLRFRESNKSSTWKAIKWEPIPVHVVTAVLQPSLDELRDVAPPEDVSGAYQNGPWLPWLALGAGILIVFSVGYWLRRKLHRHPAPIPPDQWALSELDRVSKSGLLQPGQEERLGTFISDVVRRYLDLRFQLGASSRTTDEFLAGQSSDGPLSIDQQSVIRELLDRCDLSKFARHPLSSSEGRQLLDQAHGLIEQTAQAAR